MDVLKSLITDVQTAQNGRDGSSDFLEYDHVQEMLKLCPGKLLCKENMEFMQFIPDLGVFIDNVIKRCLLDYDLGSHDTETVLKDIERNLDSLPSEQQLQHQQLQHQQQPSSDKQVLKDCNDNTEKGRGFSSLGTSPHSNCFQDLRPPEKQSVKASNGIVTPETKNTFPRVKVETSDARCVEMDLVFEANDTEEEGGSGRHTPPRPDVIGADLCTKPKSRLQLRYFHGNSPQHERNRHQDPELNSADAQDVSGNIPLVNNDHLLHPCATTNPNGLREEATPLHCTKATPLVHRSQPNNTWTQQQAKRAGLVVPKPHPCHTAHTKKHGWQEKGKCAPCSIVATTQLEAEMVPGQSYSHGGLQHYRELKTIQCKDFTDLPCAIIPSTYPPPSTLSFQSRDGRESPVQPHADCCASYKHVPEVPSCVQQKICRTSSTLSWELRRSPTSPTLPHAPRQFQDVEHVRSELSPPHQTTVPQSSQPPSLRRLQCGQNVSTHWEGHDSHSAAVRLDEYLPGTTSQQLSCSDLTTARPTRPSYLIRASDSASEELCVNPIVNYGSRHVVGPPDMEMPPFHTPPPFAMDARLVYIPVSAHSTHVTSQYRVSVDASDSNEQPQDLSVKSTRRREAEKTIIGGDSSGGGVASPTSPTVAEVAQGTSPNSLVRRRGLGSDWGCPSRHGEFFAFRKRSVSPRMKFSCSQPMPGTEASRPVDRWGKRRQVPAVLRHPHTDISLLADKMRYSTLRRWSEGRGRELHRFRDGQVL